MKAILILLVLALLVVPVCAETENLTAGNAVTMKGPFGLLVPLGFENFVPVASVPIYYNWIAFSALMLIGAMASVRTIRFVAFLLPVFAALFIYWGWMTNANPAHPTQLWGMVVVCTLIAAGVYMKGALHEKFGIAGPGSVFFNLVFFIILLEATVGMLNGFELFDFATAPSASNQYTNIDLQTAITSVSGTGGGLNDIVQIGTILTEMAFGVLQMFFAMGAAIVAFSVVVGIIYPWIPAAPQGLAFLVIMQVGIYIIYYMAFMRMVYKPIGEGDF